MSINNGSLRGFLSQLRSSRVFRRIFGGAALLAATALTLGCLFVPEILGPFALLAWVAVFLGMYLSLRVRTGYLITVSEQQFNQASRLMDELLHKSRRNAEDVQQMQVRIYRDLASQIASMQQEMAAIRQRMAQKEQVNAGLSGIEERIRQTSAGLESAVDGVVRSLGDYKRVRKVTQQGMQWMKTEVVQEVEALLRLYNLAEDRASVPLLGGWAMDPAGMLGTLLLIEKADPDVVVELGSGTSSLWIAEHLRKRGKGRLVSIDHLEEYADATRKHLAARGLHEVAEVRHAPLSTISVNGRDFQWYDPKAFEDIDRIDFLLIDGPPTATGPLARYPAMPVLASRLHKNACVLLDDASRPDEKEAIALWQQEGHHLDPIKSLGGRVSAFILQGTQEHDIGGHG